MASDGKVVIKIDSNADKAAKDFSGLTSSIKSTESMALKLDDRFSKLTSRQSSLKQSLLKLASAGKENTQQFQSLVSQYKQGEIGLKRFAKENKNAADKVNKALGLTDKLEKEMKQLNNTASKSSKAFGGMGTAVRGLITAYAGLRLLEIGKNALKVASDFEQLSISFEVLAGGKEVSDKLLDSMIGLASQTPLTTKVLADNARTMLLFGGSAETVVEELKVLGDITGGNAEKMQSLTLAYSQSRSAGRLMGQDLLQMVNAGFNPLQVISEKTGKSMLELKKAMEKGAISFEMVQQAMKDATSEGGRFFGLMNAQSKTLAGRWSTLSDNTLLLGKALGEFFAPAAKAAVEAMIPLIEGATNIIKRFTLARRAIEDLGLAELQQRLRDTYTEEDNLNNSLMAGAKTSQRYQYRINKITTEQEKLTKRIMELSKQQAEQNATQEASGDSVDELTAKWKRLLDEMNKVSGSDGALTAFEQLNKDLKEQKEMIQETATTQGIGSEALDEQIKKYKELKKQVEGINSLLDDDETKNKWEEVGNAIKSSLEGAFIASFEKGQSLLQNLGNAFKALFVQLAAKAAVLGLIGLFTGGTSTALANVAGKLTANAKGNAISDGNVVPFAKGGVVDSPQTFPMANGTGLMGEAGAEAILPLKRTSNGDLGVQATPSNVNVYNQSNSQIEVIQRPDNETDIFVRRVNAALTSERTDGSFSSALSRQQSSGVQAS